MKKTETPDETTSLEVKEESSMEEPSFSERNLPSDVQTPKLKNKETNSVQLALSILAIVIALATSAWLFFYSQHQAQLQQNNNQDLNSRLEKLQQQRSSDKQSLISQFDDLEQQLQKQSSDQNVSVKQEIEALKQRVVTLSSHDPQIWLLVQADNLVKMASIKLWIDQDAAAAIALLKSADSSLIKMGDAELIPIRRAITQDISQISVIKELDYEGTIFRLIQLSDDIDNLRLDDRTADQEQIEVENQPLSSSMSEWRQNLAKSWRNFVHNFVSIRRRDSTAEPLLAPKQEIYLRENIRLRLLIAAQAVPRHQEGIYKLSLEAVSSWARAWFNMKDPSTKAFLSELEELSQQKISKGLPDVLGSQSLLDNLIQTRLNQLKGTSTSPPGAAHGETP